MGDESERRVAEALRARATGAGRPGPPAPDVPGHGFTVRIALVVGLLGGAVLGTILALLSVLVPGLLPPL